MRRLGVNKPVSIEKVGSIDSVLSSIGPFISGVIRSTRCPLIVLILSICRTTPAKF